MDCNISGRLVQGDVFIPQTKDMTGRPMVDRNGNPKVQYFIGVAVPKNSQDFEKAWQAMNTVAMNEFRNQEHTRPGFAWKFVDGDLPENASKEGFPGHWVFRFSSGFPLKAVVKVPGTSGIRKIENPGEIKRGYYIRVFFTIAANNYAQKPGLFLNPSFVELLRSDTEITAGPDMAAMIAAAGAANIPAGSNATPPVAPPAPPVYPPLPVAQQMPAYSTPPVAPGYPPSLTYPAPPPAPVIPPHYPILNPG